MTTTGNILDNNSVSINKIGVLQADNFNVNISSASEYLIFTSRLNNENSLYSDIYFKISDTSNLRMFEESNVLTNIIDNYNDFSKISNGYSYKINRYAPGSSNITLNFEIRNKSNGKVMLTKTYNVTINFAGAPTINSVAENGETVASDNSGNTNSFSGLTENSSLTDIIDFAKNGLDTFKEAFLILPGFIWTFISIALMVALILRILGR